MYNRKVTALFEHLSKLQPVPQAKFERGDIIINKFKGKIIVSEVIGVELFGNINSIDPALNQQGAQLIGHYTLLDLVNEHKKNIRQKYNRTTFIARTDAYYKRLIIKRHRYCTELG